MKTLFTDFETRCSVDLKSTGVYRYAQEATIILFGCAYDAGEVKVYDLANGEEVPAQILKDLRDKNVLKIAHNANFERVILKACWGFDAPPEQWHCTAAHAAYAGLPRSLAGASGVAGLSGKLSADLYLCDDTVSQANHVTTRTGRPLRNITDRMSKLNASSTTGS